MEQCSRKIELLQRGAVLKAIGSIAVPMAVVMAVNTLFSYLDIWFVSRLGDDALRAIGMLFPYLNLSTSLIYAGLGTGVCVAVARHSGSARDTSFLAWMKTGLILIIPIWIVVFTIVFCGQELLFSGTAVSCRAMAGTYSFWYLAFFPVMATGAVMCATMRGGGNTVRPALYSVICIVVKAVLTPVLSFGQVSLWGVTFVFLDDGIRGVAIASGISYILFFFLMLLEFRRYTFGWFAKMWAVELQWGQFKKVLRSALVAILVPFLSCVVLMVALGVMDAQNSAAAEAFSLAKRFELYLIQFAVCLGSGTMVVISSSLAVKNYYRAREAALTALKIVSVVAVPVMVWMFLHSELFYQTLTSNNSIIAFGRDYFVWGGISTIFTVGIIVLNFIFQAIGRPERALPFLILTIVVVQGGGSLILHAGLIDYIGYLILISAGAALSFALALDYLMNTNELNPNRYALNHQPAISLRYPVKFVMPLLRTLVLTKRAVCVMLVLGSLLFVGCSPRDNEFYEVALTKQISLVDPVYPKRPPRTFELKVYKGSQGYPQGYSMNIRNGVCLDNKCKLVEVTMFWDALGQYQRIKYPSRNPLTKDKHKPFTKSDYKMLDSILKDKVSVLRDNSLAYLIKASKPAKKGKELKVDGITQATPATVRKAVVKGAAWTTWVLWQYANSEIVPLLRAETEAQCTPEYVSHIFDSKNWTKIEFIMNYLLKQEKVDPSYVGRVVQVATLADKQQLDLAVRYFEKTKSDKSALYRELIKNLSVFKESHAASIIKLIATDQKLDVKILEYLTRELNTLPFYSVHLILKEVEKRQLFSAVVESNVASLLASANFFIARRAHAFLTDKEISADTVDKVKQFRQKYSDRL